MIDFYVMAMKNYFNFQGRSRRSEFWYFYLVSIIASIVLTIADFSLGLVNEAGNGPLSTLVGLVHLIPTISASTRRLHDTNRSGWWQLVPFYNIYLLAQPGLPEPNRFGTNPKTTPINVAETFN